MHQDDKAAPISPDDAMVGSDVDFTITEAGRFHEAAARRNISHGELIARLLKTIARDDMFAAVLDD
jgi:hypothetical protein